MIQYGVALLLIVGALDVVAMGQGYTALPHASALAMAQAPAANENYYVLSLLNADPRARAVIAKNDELHSLFVGKERAAQTASRSCRENLPCIAEEMVFSEQEIKGVALALRSAYRTSPAIHTLVDGPLRRSGKYSRQVDEPGDVFLADAWRNAAEGINRSIEVYSGVTKPRFSDIDSPLEDPASTHYRTLATLSLDIVVDSLSSADLFFEPSERYALILLEMNGLEKFRQFDSLMVFENRTTAAYIHTIRWSKYPYSAILVPGASEPMRRLRTTLAAERFRDGLAPILIVSGSAVRPPRTNIIEAIEMKRQLIDDFAIPPHAILIDPFARHTTTNLRNAVRAIIHYGLPLDENLIVTTDPDQSANIASTSFQTRCMGELGYMPVTVVRQVSPFDLVVAPNPVSLQINSLDPADP